MQVILRYFPDLTAEQQERFAALDALYREWNARINVISRKDIDALYEHHVLHSLGIAKAFPLSAGMRVMDLGTGGGFPGIPLAVLYPDVHFYLVDSIAKKVRVCDEVVKALSLTNVTTQWTRVEQLGERFDCIVSRAVAPLDTLVRWSRPLSRHLVCLKGIDEVEPSKSVDIKPLSQWFSEDFFATKAVIHKRLTS